MSGFLESLMGRLRVRVWLCVLMLIANFFLVYGAIQFFNHGKSSVMYTLALTGSIILALVLAFPNTEAVTAPEMQDPNLRD